MPGFQRMGGKGPKLVRYAEYLRYIDAGEPRGTLSHEDWLAKHPKSVNDAALKDGACNESSNASID